MQNKISRLADERHFVRYLPDARAILGYVKKRQMRSPLHVAVMEQQPEVVSDLIFSNSCDVQAKDFDEKTPLYYAVRSGNLEIIKLLLEAGAKIYKSYIREAVESLNADVLKLFLNKILAIKNWSLIEDYGEDCSVETLFELAFRHGNSSIVKLLLSYYNAEFDADIKLMEESLLFKAVEMGNVNIVKVLLDYGLNVDQTWKNNDDDDEFAGNTLMHMALDPKNLDILRLLIDYKANVNAKNKRGSTPLHLAIKLDNKAGKCDSIVKLLLESGAHINSPEASFFYDHFPLITAVTLENESVAKLLLDFGAKVNTAEPFNKDTAMHAAVRLENEGIVKLLLDFGASVEIQDECGDTALHLAAERDNLNILRLVLDNYSADLIDEINRLVHYNPLQLAIIASNYEACKMLLEAGADINYYEGGWYTAIHVAADSENINLDIVKLLLEYGADLNMWSNYKKSPFMLLLRNSTDMAEKDRTEAFKLLLKYTDVNLVDRANGKNILAHFLNNSDEFLNKLILEHVAKVKVSKVSNIVDSSLLDTISRDRDKSDYFNECIQELENAKSTKLRNCYVTFFNLLVDDEYKLIKYAGNQDLVEDSKNSVQKYPIYGLTMESNMAQGIEGRKLFDAAADLLTYHLPILNPTHLIIRDTLDSLSVEDWNNLCQK